MPDCIQVFYRRDFDSAEISLLDERNALWRQRQALRDERSLLAPLQRFLQSLLYRRNALSLGGTGAGRAGYPLLRVALPTTAECMSSLARRRRPLAGPRCTSYRRYSSAANASACRSPVRDHQEFPNWSTAPACSRRSPGISWRIARKANPTPCYLTDLDLSRLFADEQPQTLHYLRYKSVLETALNQALLEQ